MLRVLEMMEESMYNKLVSERDKLVMRTKQPMLMKHRVMIQKELSNVREQIKQAHKEQYKNEQRDK